MFNLGDVLLALDDIVVEVIGVDGDVLVNMTVALVDEVKVGFVIVIIGLAVFIIVGVVCGCGTVFANDIIVLFVGFVAVTILFVDVSVVAVVIDFDALSVVLDVLMDIVVEGVIMVKAVGTDVDVVCGIVVIIVAVVVICCVVVAVVVAIVVLCGVEKVFAVLVDDEGIVKVVTDDLFVMGCITVIVNGVATVAVVVFGVAIGVLGCIADVVLIEVFVVEGSVDFVGVVVVVMGVAFVS